MILQALTANLIDGKTKRMKCLTLVTNLIIECPIWEIDSELKCKYNNESNGEITTLPLLKIRTNQNRVPPDEDKEFS